METIYPNYSKFCKLAKKGNLIPVYKELIADVETPLTVYKKLEDKYSFLLESVEVGEKIARYSFIGSDPSMLFIAKNNEVEIISERNNVKKAGSPLKELSQLLKQYSQVKIPELPSFCGGFVGYFGYEVISQIEDIQMTNPDDLNLPDIFLMLVDSGVIFDHFEKKMILFALADVKKDISLGYEKALSKLEKLEKKLKSHSHFLDSIAIKEKEKNMKLKSNTSLNEFIEMVKDGKKYISRGDIIQTVLSQRFEVGVSIDPFVVYRNLRIVNPSPYMFYLNLDKIKLVGSSPEVMVKISDGKGYINPIAGTRPRGATEDEDIELEKELLASEKERAEHLMLVDLARNDLGRVCEFGTVKTSELMHIERYSHVMHIVSCVEGKIKKGIDSVDVLRASFPAGTVTGAPKVRAMEIINELEKSKRGPYAGCVGYLSFNGDIDTCITIRTILFKEKKAYIQVGAGIVADSFPKKEYEETVNKAKGMLKAISLSL